MRILFVIDHLGSGGAQRQMVNLALGLANRGHSVEFFIYYPQYDFFRPAITNASIPIHDYKKSGRLDFRCILALRSLIIKSDYDILLSFLDTPNLYTELVSFGKKRPIVIVAERSSYSPSGPSLYKRLLEGLHFIADGIVVNSHSQARNIRHYSPWLQNKMRVIYNGLDLNLFSDGHEISKRPNTLLAVGSVVPNKNVVGLAKSLVEYKLHYGYPPKVEWVGTIYPDELSQAEFNQVNEILGRNGLKNYWKWLGTQTDIQNIYPLYSVFIHPSFREGLSNAVCEAMSCGLPVLLSNIGEHPILINHGTNGMLFNPNSPSDIAKVIHKYFLANESIKKLISESVRNFAKQEFSIDVMVARYENYFLSLIDN